MADYFLYLFNQHDPEFKLNLTFLEEHSEGWLEAEDVQGKASIYRVIQGDDNPLKSALYNQSLEQGFDYCILPCEQVYGPFRLAVFDMDSTLIPIEVIDELAVQAGVGEQVAAITEAAMRGELDFNQSLEQRVSQLKGLSVEAIQVVREQLQFNPGVEAFCRYLLEQGGKIAIASGGFMPFAEELRNRLPFSHVAANRLLQDGDKLTGDVEHPIVNADVKADSLKQWMTDEGLVAHNCVAVGDGANDLKMLRQAGIGVAYKAKPTLGQSADCVLNVGFLDSLIELLPIIEERHASIIKSDNAT